MKYYEWNKITIIFNFYVLFRISHWSSIDIYIFGAGFVLLLFNLYTEWVY